MRPVMILAGGTGGHVFPALAVAKQLQRCDVPVIWVGTERGIEYRVVPEAGFKLVTLQIQGLRGKGLKYYVQAPFIIVKALWQALTIILQHRPSVLLGMGGFVTGPCGLIAVLMRKPLVLHEQNAIMGLTNRILAPLAHKIFAGFVYHSDKIEFCGNPVRNELLTIDHPDTRFAQRDSSPIRLLIVGGSQGSKALNTVVPEALKSVADGFDLAVHHQTGTGAHEAVSQAYACASDQLQQAQVQVSEFINDMQAAYSWADLIICRSGAMTLAEIASVGLGAILVPYPYAVDDHQTVNAQQFVEQGAAYLIAEPTLTADLLAGLLHDILGHNKYRHMASQAKALASVNAAERVAQECIRLAGHKDPMEVG